MLYVNCWLNVFLLFHLQKSFANILFKDIEAVKKIEEHGPVDMDGTLLGIEVSQICMRNFTFLNIKCKISLSSILDKIFLSFSSM